MQTLTLLSRKTPKFIAFPPPTQSRSISSLKHGKKFPAGHNAAGRITSFHRGGRHKRLFRQIDFKRSVNSSGVVERIEYDPNRSSRIALVRWIQAQNFRHQNEPPLPANAHQKLIDASAATAKVSSTFSFSSLPGNNLDGRVSPSEFLSLDSFPRIAVAGAKPTFFAVEREDLGTGVQKHEFLLKEIKKWDLRSPIWGHRLKRKAVLNWKNLGQRDGDAEVRVAKPNFKDGKVIPSQVISYAFRRSKDRPIEASGLGILLAKPNAIEEDKKEKKVEHAPVSYILASHQMEVGSKIVNYDGSKGGGSKKQETLDLNFQVGNCMPLADIRLGTFVHDIEIHPGQGAKLTRAAGTYAKVVKEPVNQQCLVRLPSGREMLIDSRCKATIGVVSNPSHGTRKLRKAGQNRWRGWRPVVRGVAMNPIDHPHGGGEGRTSGGRPSVSPWGKPTKSGFKTAAKSKRDRK